MTAQAGRLPALLVVVALLPIAAAAHPAASVATLSRALECHTKFEPQRVLRALQKDGVIGTHKVAHADGIPVFKVLRPFRLRGLPVLFVEGWDFQGSLFTHAPGTAPGTFVGITVAAPREETALRFSEIPEGPVSDRFTWARYVFDESEVFLYRKKPGISVVKCDFNDKGG